MPYYVCPYCGHEGALDKSCCGERGHMQFRLTDDERLFFYKVAHQVEAQPSGGARPNQIRVALSRYKSILHALSKEEDE